MADGIGCSVWEAQRSMCLDIKSGQLILRKFFFLPLLLTHVLSVQQNHCFIFSHAWQHKTIHTGLYNTTLQNCEAPKVFFFSNSSVMLEFYMGLETKKKKKKEMKGKVVSEL